MQVANFTEILGSEYYTGVPDSQLKALCNYLMNTYGIDVHHHVIGANEGNCVAMAAGYYLSTGRIPVVYMQNSGEGNIINPVASLISDDVYGIPMIFVIGWRGEPGVHDEPQHVYQGKVTCRLLEDMNIEYMILDKDTQINEVRDCMDRFRSVMDEGRSVAFVVRKGALSYDGKTVYKNDHQMKREDIIEHIVKAAGDDPIVSTTGKASRELYEIRDRQGMDHSRDFLTVGSMGHSSSIALGIAAQKPDRKIWCIDGDGAALMHMGAMALIGSNKLPNMIHVLINNGAHETVGGMNTVADDVDMTAIALACGYPNAICVDNFEDLDMALDKARIKDELSFIEVKCAIGAREDLGRPGSTPKENKTAFMKRLNT